MPHVEHLWTVLCRSVRLGPDGLMTLDGLIDMVRVDGLPSEPVQVPFECFVISQWRRNEDPGTSFLQRVAFQFEHRAETRVQVAGPDEVRVVDQHLFSVVNRIPALPLMGHGQYWFIVQQQAPGGEWSDVTPTAGLWVPSPEMLNRSGGGSPSGAPQAKAQANIAPAKTAT